MYISNTSFQNVPRIYHLEIYTRIMIEHIHGIILYCVFSVNIRVLANNSDVSIVLQAYTRYSEQCNS